MLESVVTRLVEAFSRRRALVLACAAAAGLLALSLASRIRLDQDLRRMLPSDDGTIADYYDTLTAFRPMERLYVDVGAEETRAAGEAADALAARLASVPGLRAVTTAVDPAGARKAFELLAAAGPAVFTEDDARALPERLAPGRIRERLAWFKRQLDGPQGAVLKEVVRRDPAGVTDLLLAKLAPLQAGFGGARLEDGRITSADGRHVLLVAETGVPPADTARSAALVAGALRAAREVETSYAAAGVRVSVTGAHRSSLDNVELVTEDAARTTAAASAACLLVTLLFFRRWWMGLLTVVPLAFGCAVAGGVVALLSDRVSAIAVGCGAALVGIAIDYGTHVLYHLDAGGPGGPRPAAERVGYLAGPIAAGALSAAGAFLLLVLSPVPGYRQIGVFSAAAVLASAAFALAVLPLLVPRSRGGGDGAARPAARACAAVAGWRRGRTVVLGTAAAALTAAAAAGLGRVSFEGDPRAMNGLRPETRADEARLQAAWGDALALTLVVAEAPTADAALELDGRVAGALRELQAGGVVAAYSCVSDLCPSRAAQAGNAARWKAFWDAGRRAETRRAVEESAAALGFRPGAFDAWERALDAEPARLAPADFAGTPVERAVSERLAETPAGAVAGAVVKLRDRDAVGRLREAVRAAAPGVRVIDAREAATRIAALAKAGLGRYAALAGAVVVAVLLLIFGSAALAAAALLPVAVALAWTLGLLGLLGVPVSLASSAFVVFVVGVGVDTSQLLVAERLAVFRGGAGRAAETAASVALCALTTLLGFGALLLARHPALYAVGVTTTIGMACTLVAVPVFAPAAAGLVLRRDRTGGAPRLVDLAGGLWAGAGIFAVQAALLLAIPLLVLRHPRSPERRRDALRRMSHGWARGLVATFPPVRVSWEGIAPETFQPPAIVVSNHQSTLDFLLVIGLPADIRLTVKRKWWDSPLIGFTVHRLDHIPVDPGAPLETMEACRSALAGGACVHFFPEGSRSPDGFFTRFHRGAFRLAAELGCDLLPVVICDSWEALHPGAWGVEGARVRVRALPRITPRTFDYAAGPVALMRHAESVLAEGFREALDRNHTPAVLRKKVGRLYRYQGPCLEQYVFWKLRTDPLFAVVDGAVPRQGRILDLGCGVGLVAHWLLQKGPDREVLGIDYDARKVAVARATAAGRRRIAFEAGDVLERELPPADAALLLDVLHYLPPDRQDRLLARVREALRPGGRLVVRDMAAEGTAGHRQVLFWERLATRIGFNRAAEGIHVRTAEATDAALRAAGFGRVEEVAGAGRGSNRMWVAWV